MKPETWWAVCWAGLESISTGFDARGVQVPAMYLRRADARSLADDWNLRHGISAFVVRKVVVRKAK